MIQGGLIFLLLLNRGGALFFNDYPSTNFIRIYIDNVDIGFDLVVAVRNLVVTLKTILWFIHGRNRV